MDIKTYPEMNGTIKDLLRRSEKPMNLYILARIEELEKQVENLIPPPNKALTLEELREMDGEPVWIHSFSSVQKKTRISGWAIVEIVCNAYVTLLRAGVNCRTKKWFANYGRTWLAYRRKPEEGTI